MDIYPASQQAPLSKRGRFTLFYEYQASHISREDLLKAGVHAQSQAGIHGDSSPNGGAFSICISEGYEDNRDLGDKMYVTLLPHQETRPHCCW